MPFAIAAAEAESDANAAVRAIAYTLASDTLAALDRLDSYRDSPLLSGVRQMLFELTERDPSKDTQIAAQMKRVNELYDAGRFPELRELADQMLEANTSLEGAVILDAIKIMAQLHTDAVDEALSGIKRLLDIDNYADYVLLSLHEALKKTARELHRVVEAGFLEAERDRLQSALDRVLERYYQLAALAGVPTQGDQQ
ncbi:hypothetical protein [Mycobacterium marinum]|uniref:hypothetical protein n=1 Tax=Mycobacterium marinum TaxID=1781 RepID=UPI000E3D68E4|nr:hypothetical protein [Mycobacterium marinum]